MRNYVAVKLQEGAVADLDDLSFYMLAHVGSEEEAGVGLVHGVAFRTGEIHEMFAELQHLCAAGLFAGLVCQMGGGYGSARSHGIDADVGVDQTHGYVFGQRVDRAF